MLILRIVLENKLKKNIYYKTVFKVGLLHLDRLLVCSSPYRQNPQRNRKWYHNPKKPWSSVEYYAYSRADKNIFCKKREKSISLQAALNSNWVSFVDMQFCLCDTVQLYCFMQTTVMTKEHRSLLYGWMVKCWMVFPRQMCWFWNVFDISYISLHPFVAIYITISPFILYRSALLGYWHHGHGTLLSIVSLPFWENIVFIRRTRLKCHTYHLFHAEKGNLRTSQLTATGKLISTHCTHL